MKFNHILLAFFWSAPLVGQSFTEEEVILNQLKGTLTIPKKKTRTAVLMIAGSGPTGRNGNSSLGFTNNSLKMIAHQLADKRYAVLRYDKRGIAQSAEAIDSPVDLRFEHFVDDAKSWLDFLDERGYKELVVMGHSQGSLVGMLATQGDKRITKYISIAGAAEDAGTLILKQLEKRAPVALEEATNIMDSLKAGHTVNKVNPLLASLFGPQIQEFLKSYIQYTPKEEIKKLTIPVLIVNGTTDLQVDIIQAKMLKEAYPEAELTLVENMNHVLKEASSDYQENLATYNNPDLPLKEGLMDAIVNFMKSK